MDYQLEESTSADKGPADKKFMLNPQKEVVLFLIMTRNDMKSYTFCHGASGHRRFYCFMICIINQRTIKPGLNRVVHFELDGENKLAKQGRISNVRVVPFILRTTPCSRQKRR